MKKLLVLLLTIFALNGCEEDTTIIDATTADKKLPKVDVCHYDDITGTWETLNINQNALKAHLNHGDTQGGRCGYTYVPDDTFEEALIIWGYDDYPLDDYVPTANINKIEEMTFIEAGYGRPPWDEWSFTVGDFTGIEDFVSLKKLYINTHHFPDDLSHNLALESITAFNSTPSGIIGDRKIDLTNNVKLNSIMIVNSRANYLLLPETNTLSSFHLQYTDIKSIDLSKNTGLKSVWIKVNLLEKINLNNDNNKFLHPYVGGNPFLNCIQVDDVDYSLDNWGFYVPPSQRFYSTDCGF